MDFIYINRDGDNEELRYSIRSVIKNIKDADIWVVGGKPEWYLGKFIPVANVGDKFKNITECYKAICEIDGITDFIAMNDDFFIIEEMDEIPYLYDGSLLNKAEAHGNLYGYTEYYRVLIQANKMLNKMGIKDPLNYDIHTPMKMNIDNLKEIVSLSNAPRSVYGNIFSVGGSEIKDVKVYNNSQKLKNFEYFISTEDNSFDRVYDSILKDKFNKPTKYEK